MKTKAQPSTRQGIQQMDRDIPNSGNSPSGGFFRCGKPPKSQNRLFLLDLHEEINGFLGVQCQKVDKLDDFVLNWQLVALLEPGRL